MLVCDLPVDVSGHDWDSGIVAASGQLARITGRVREIVASKAGGGGELAGYEVLGHCGDVRISYFSDSVHQPAINHSSWLFPQAPDTRPNPRPPRLSCWTADTGVGAGAPSPRAQLHPAAPGSATRRSQATLRRLGRPRPRCGPRSQRPPPAPCCTHHFQTPGVPLSSRGSCSRWRGRGHLGKGSGSLSEDDNMAGTHNGTPNVVQPPSPKTKTPHWTLHTATKRSPRLASSPRACLRDPE